MTQITHILCPVDFSDLSRHALDHAAALARWYQARLTLLYVFESRPAMDLPAITLSDPVRDQLMEDLRRFAVDVAPEVSLSLIVEEALYADDEILAQAVTLGADLIVLATHGRSGFERLFLGSVTEKVSRKATCPVLVVPPHAGDVVPAPVAFRRILCPVDFSALPLALSLAEEADATLTLLHVVEMPAETYANPMISEPGIGRILEDVVTESRARLSALVPEQARTYCTIDVAVARGSAHQQVLALAAQPRADLIVMGVHGHGVIDRLVFGSTTDRVIRSATCPVLMTRQP